MSDILDAEGWRFERLDGSVSGTERQKAIDRFSDKNSDSFIFILSTRAVSGPNPNSYPSPNPALTLTPTLTPTHP